MKAHAMTHTIGAGMYGRLALMVFLSFLTMYVMMYGMVNAFGNVYMNVNQVYMAGLMAAPMGIIELVLMRAMYRDRNLNIVVLAGSIVALAVFWFLLRQQTAVSERQFLRSMIPHHAGAILMCQRADVRDPEIVDLCKDIVSGQQREIDQMKRKLATLQG